MRAILAAFLLASCATAPEPTRPPRDADTVLVFVRYDKVRVTIRSWYEGEKRVHRETAYEVPMPHPIPLPNLETPGHTVVGRNHD